MKVIEITVGPKGETQVETKGYSGGGCREASKFVEEALGARTGERLTGEFFAREEARQDMRQSS